MLISWKYQKEKSKSNNEIRKIIKKSVDEKID